MFDCFFFNTACYLFLKRSMPVDFVFVLFILKTPAESKTLGQWMKKGTKHGRCPGLMLGCC